MAIHTSLPIYKVTYDLALLAATLTRSMPRDIKGLYGRQLSEECAALVLQVYRANSARDKVPYLDALLERLQTCTRFPGASMPGRSSSPAAGSSTDERGNRGDWNSEVV